MDPINFAEHNLPKIEYKEIQKSKTYLAYDDYDYNEFKKEFVEWVTASCNAITFDDEIIYNTYKNMSIRESIQEEIIRNMIIDDPHSLLINIFKKNTNSRIIIYLFGENPWYVAIYSSPTFITVEYYKSKKYEEVFERNEVI
jgi:hypothetical protein